MVAITSLLSILAMTLMVNAAPAELVARGEDVAHVTTFNAADCRDPARTRYIVDRASPVSPGHVLANTCFSEAAYGSIAIDSVGARCQFEKHYSGNCDDAPYDVVTTFSGTRKCLHGEPAPVAFWIVRCT